MDAAADQVYIGFELLRNVYVCALCLGDTNSLNLDTAHAAATMKFFPRVCCAFRNGMTAFFSALHRPRLSSLTHRFATKFSPVFHYIIDTPARPNKRNKS